MDARELLCRLGDLHTVLCDNLAIAEHLVDKGTVLLDGEGKRHRWYWVNETGLVPWNGSAESYTFSMLELSSKWLDGSDRYMIKPLFYKDLRLPEDKCARAMAYLEQ